VGASPTRQPLQPEAIGAVMEVTKWLKPSISVSPAFDSHSAMQKAAGLSNPRVLRSADDKNEIVIIFDTTEHEEGQGVLRPSSDLKGRDDKSRSHRRADNVLPRVDLIIVGVGRRSLGLKQNCGCDRRDLILTCEYVRLKPTGGGWSNLWCDRSADRWAWFIGKKVRFFFRRKNPTASP